MLEVLEMVDPPIPLEPRNDPFQYALRNTSQIVLKRLLHFELLTSTNEYLKQQGNIGEQEGLIVLADEQTEGRGRLNRSWYSPRGGLYFSILLRPKSIKAEQVPLITLTTGVAVAKVLQSALSIQPSLKWPNDVMVGQRKVGGILCESTFIGNDIDFVVAGIGINANSSTKEFPVELQAAASLQDLVQHPINLPRLFGYLIGQLEFWYLRLCDKGFPAIASHWKQLCNHLNHQISIKEKDRVIIGIAKDIAADGSLILLTDKGPISIRSGDVTSLQYLG